MHWTLNIRAFEHIDSVLTERMEFDAIFLDATKQNKTKQWNRQENARMHAREETKYAYGWFWVRQAKLE